MIFKNIKIGLLYFLVSISVPLALYIVYTNILDFFDPNSISFQMLNLSDSKIYLLDLTEIWIYVALLVVLTVWLVKRNIKKVTIICISIWVFTLLVFFIENRLSLNI